jgi:hypothetical protein
LETLRCKIISDVTSVARGEVVEAVDVDSTDRAAAVGGRIGVIARVVVVVAAAAAAAADVGVGSPPQREGGIPRTTAGPGVISTLRWTASKGCAETKGMGACVSRQLTCTEGEDEDRAPSVIHIFMSAPARGLTQ